MRVLDLIRDRNVSIVALADAVQTDPAMVAKVLKTVNSSFYGLTTPCPSIQRAMSLLGLNTVKSIVLGFSLVDFTKSIGGGGGDQGFDLGAYWQRAVYSAAGARLFARRARCWDAEETFIGALVADIGLLAAVAALRDEYLSVLTTAPEDHDELPIYERRALATDHAAIGLRLALKWRLPEQLAACVGYHHEPDACPKEFENAARAVYLGRLAASFLSSPDGKGKLGPLLHKSGEWFSLSREEARAVIEEASRDGAELAKLMEVKAGARPDASALLAEAQEQMLQSQVELQQQQEELRRKNEELSRQTVTDGLTQAHNRAFFDAEAQRAFERSKSEKRPFSVIFLDGDKFKSVNDTHGHAAGDAVLKELSKRAMEVASRVGSVCRYGGEEFAIVLPGVALDKASRLAELLRRHVCATPFDLSRHGVEGLALPITVSIGVCGTSAAPTQGSAGEIVHAADQCVYAAKHAGRNRVFACAPGGRPAPFDPNATPERAARASFRAAPGAARAVSVLVVEDDPLAAKLISVLFETKAKEWAVSIVGTGRDAMDALAGATVPDIVLCDMHLPDMYGAELIAKMTAKLGPRTPVTVLASTDDSGPSRDAAIQAGATLFFGKAQLCTNFADCAARMLAARDTARRDAA